MDATHSAEDFLAAIASNEGSLDAGDAARLLACLGHQAKGVRRSAAKAVGEALRQGTIAREDCEALLVGHDAATRWGAAFALSAAGVRSPAIVDAALPALDDADGDVRWAAAAVVAAAARDSADLRDRLRNFGTDPSARMRKMALLCLCDSGEQELQPFVSALADIDPYVRLAALTSLARRGDRSTESLSAISEVAKTDARANVRRAADAVLRRLAGTPTQGDTDA